MCNKPVVPNGSVSPSSATIEYADTYEVTCDAGFVVDGSSSTMTCGAGDVFDQTQSLLGVFDKNPTCGMQYIAT